MRRELRVAASLGGLASALFAATAHAETAPIHDAEYPDALGRPEPIDADARHHDGLFVRGGFGVSYFRSKVPRANDDPVSTSAEVLVGGTPFRGLVLGGGVIGEGLGRLHPLVAYAAFAQLYPDPQSGFNVQVLAAFTILEDEPSILGPLGAIGAGYEFFVARQVSVGAFARLGYARGYGDDGVRVNAPFASIAVVLTWH